MPAAIIGLYNSGSSVLARITSILGCNMGPPHWGFNFESRMLRAQLVDWWYEPYMIEQVKQEDRIPFLKWWLEYYSQQSEHVCAKHPLLCLSANDLQLAWGEDVKYIRAYRNLNESIKKLEERGWWNREEDPFTAESIQKTLWHASEEFFSKQPHLHLDYQDLLQNPQREVLRVIDYLELSPSEENIRYAIEIVEQPR